MRIRLPHTVALVTAVLAPAAVASAQLSLTPVQIESGESAARNTEADALETEALRNYGSPSHWIEAARLHRRAAALRADDPRAVESWRLAAWAYSAAGDQGVARTMMEKAAERAAAAGDVESAANSYIDATLIALEGMRSDRVPDLIRKTRVLASSPLLSADRRASILRRIGEAPPLAQAWSDR